MDWGSTVHLVRCRRRPRSTDHRVHAAHTTWWLPHPLGLPAPPRDARESTLLVLRKLAPSHARSTRSRGGWATRGGWRARAPAAGQQRRPNANGRQPGQSELLSEPGAAHTQSHPSPLTHVGTAVRGVAAWAWAWAWGPAQGSSSSPARRPPSARALVTLDASAPRRGGAGSLALPLGAASSSAALSVSRQRRVGTLVHARRDPDGAPPARARRRLRRRRRGRCRGGGGAGRRRTARTASRSSPSPRAAPRPPRAPQTAEA